MHLLTQIKNATIVNEGRSFIGSVVIEDDRVLEIIEGEEAVPGRPVDEVFDATDCYLLPGIIDEHVHFREPGLTDKATIASESRAAAAGGVTTYFDMPNTLPQTTGETALQEKMALAARTSLVNYGFFLGATDANAHTLTALNPRSFCGIKIFMGASTGNMLVSRKEAIHHLFENAQVPIMVHCEDNRIITDNARRFQAELGEDPDVRFHSEIRSEEACYKSTHEAVKLARKYGTRLRVAHLSTAKELALFSPKYPQITAEACVPHLLFTADDYADKGTRIKCNPSVKTAADRAALRRALSDGTISTVATDHAPHRLTDKRGGCIKAASGMPMVQFSLVAMLELVDEGVLTLETLVRLMCHRPAELFDIENRGYIREGYKADLVLVRPRAPWTLTPNRIRSKCLWSPLEGHVFHWRVERTYCNGFPVFCNGHLTDANFCGEAVTFNR